MASYFANHVRRERFPWSLYHRDLARRIAGVVGEHGQEPRVLVVGCGLEPFVEGGPSGAVYFGCDIDPRTIDACRALHPDMKERLAVCPSGDALPNEGGFGELFDVAIAKEVVEHVPRPAAWAQMVAKKVRRGGDLVLTTPNYGRLSTLPILEATVLEAFARRDGYSRKHIHPSKFDRASLARLDVGPDMRLVGVEMTWTRWAMVGRWTKAA